MRPEEREMIQDLFDRVGATTTESNDRDAERFIRDAVARNPNAPYVLVQTVLLQEEALRRADERIRELQEVQAANDDRGSRSFLDSARDSGRRFGQSGGGGSVPNAGVRQNDADSFRRPDDTRYAQPPVAQPGPPMGGGGGFLSSALSTVGGVAGGMLLADGIRGLFGGHAGAGDLFGGARATETPSASTDNKTSTVDWGAKDRAQDAQQDADDDQAAAQDAADDQYDGGWDDSDSMDA
jgi:hypothetical protein